jgi:PLP dependent protein
MNIAEQIQLVRLNIEQSCTEFQRQASDVRLLAVSKTHPVSLIQDAVANGITEFGESYLQEALDKIVTLQGNKIIWHFIGPIQSNKTKPIAEHFDWVQSVDRLKILKRLSQQRPKNLKPLQVCIQANLFEEPQKKGASLTELPELLEIANDLPHICLRGLMVIPPKQESFERQLDQFRRVQATFHSLQKQFISMDTLSMGMSSDMRAAISCGSNMVRIGTGIFGVRGTSHQ